MKFSSKLPCRFNELFRRWLSEKSTINVVFSSYRLVSGQRASLETASPPPPRDRLSLGGQCDLISWLFLPNHIYGTSSSTPVLRYNRSALAVTARGRFCQNYYQYVVSFAQTPKSRVKRRVATSNLALPQGCYLANGAKRQIRQMG